MAGTVWRTPLCIFTAAALLTAALPARAERSNGTYLSSRLMPSASQKSCPKTGDPMYRADAIVTGTDERQRPWGFAKALRAVLVKVSGDPRLKDDARTGRLAAEAANFIACFEYADLMAGIPLHDDQGTSDRPHRLTVLFDPSKIDATLAQLGDKPWRGKRPVVVPVLLVQGPKLPPYVLTTEAAAGAEQRGAFANAAEEFGMAVRNPSAARLKAWGGGEARLPYPLPRPAGGEAIIVGTLVWSESLPGWTGQWRMRWQGRDYDWGISGVNYDAAFRNIVRGVMLVASGTAMPDAGD